MHVPLKIIEKPWSYGEIGRSRDPIRQPTDEALLEADRSLTEQ
jgi:hypothetical protein